MRTIELLAARLTDKIAIVDVGASDLTPNAPPPYDPLVKAELGHVTGFEPNEDQFVKLPQTDTHRYLRLAVGDGEDVTLHITRYPGFTSSLKPKRRFVERIGNFERQTKVMRTESLPTVRLDDIAEIERIDLLKIDIQGGEVAAFRGGIGKLQDGLCIHTEVAFNQIYVDQPTFADQMTILDTLGFELFNFFSLSAFPAAAGSADLDRRTRRREFRQIVDGDAVFVPKQERLERMATEEVYRLLAIMLLSYRAVSFALYLIELLGNRGEDAAKLKEIVIDEFRL